MKMAKFSTLRPWVPPANFKINSSVFEEWVREALVQYCIENDNMYDYCDGDFTGVFNLDTTLFIDGFIEEGETEDDDVNIDFINIIKEHLPEDFSEKRIGVYFCNG
ncbi:hypothetical protein [Yersinia phage fHe-Yen9-03]|uniref:Uncharacterized protein n=1 Tax=Yersinia phage fHe-Yen9-03 TaxID=2052743 RepID=A0A2C9D1G4_9CAUD|nr:hypothetical protein [Yersinia phage fHe-Yen9-03]